MLLPPQPLFDDGLQNNFCWWIFWIELRRGGGGAGGINGSLIFIKGYFSLLSRQGKVCYGRFQPHGLRKGLAFRSSTWSLPCPSPWVTLPASPSLPSSTASSFPTVTEIGSRMSVFDCVLSAAPGAAVQALGVFDINRRYQEDDSPDKANLSIGGLLIIFQSPLLDIYTHTNEFTGWSM